MPPRRRMWECPFKEAHARQGTRPTIVKTRLAFKRHLCLHHACWLVELADGTFQYPEMTREEFEAESANHRRCQQHRPATCAPSPPPVASTSVLPRPQPPCDVTAGPSLVRSVCTSNRLPADYRSTLSVTDSTSPSTADDDNDFDAWEAALSPQAQAYVDDRLTRLDVWLCADTNRSPLPTLPMDCNNNESSRTVPPLSEEDWERELVHTALFPLSLDADNSSSLGSSAVVSGTVAMSDLLPTMPTPTSSSSEVTVVESPNAVADDILDAYNDTNDNENAPIVGGNMCNDDVTIVDIPNDMTVRATATTNTVTIATVSDVNSSAIPVLVTQRQDNATERVVYAHCNSCTCFRKPPTLYYQSTQTAKTDYGPQLRHVSVQADESSCQFVPLLDTTQVIETLADVLQSDYISTPFQVARIAARRLCVPLTDYFNRTILAALAHGMALWERTAMEQLLETLRPWYHMDSTGQLTMLMLSFELNRRQHRPADPPGTRLFDCPPDAATAACAHDNTSSPIVVDDSDSDDVDSDAGRRETNRPPDVDA